MHCRKSGRGEADGQLRALANRQGLELGNAVAIDELAILKRYANKIGAILIDDFRNFGEEAPTIVAPRNERTWLIGFAIALVLLPAKSKPTARGFVATSSTISDPEGFPTKSELIKAIEDLFPDFTITVQYDQVAVVRSNCIAGTARNVSGRAPGADSAT